MGRDARGLPSGWDTPIPDAIWPEAMLSAIRHDCSALSSARVIATIRLWRAQASDETQPEKQREAKRHLIALGQALLPTEGDLFDADGVTTALPEPREDEVPEPPSDQTVDTFQLPPKPSGLRRTSSRAMVAPDFDTPPTIFADDAIVDAVDSDTDSRVPRHATPAVRSTSTGASAPPTSGFNEEDEKPTTAFLRSTTQSREAPPPPPPPPPLPPEARRVSLSARLGSSSATFAPLGEDHEAARRATPYDEDDKPTRHIDLPPPKPNDDDDLEATHALLEEEGSPAADLVQELVDDDAAAERGSSRLAPKPGIIRRRSTRARREVSKPRPRAAMHHVRSLYGVLMPFAAELIPLPLERRSRRFWARWREVAGDRGVRRDFIEELLGRAHDARTLVCELISEVQSVDVRSVYALVDKLDSAGELDAADAKPGTPDRTRGPLVGASVRVEGVARDEE